MNRRTKRAIVREIESNAELIAVCAILLTVAIMAIAWSIPK